MARSHAEKRRRVLAPDLSDWLRITGGSLLYLALSIPCLAVPGGVLFLRPGAGVVATAALRFGPTVGFGVGLLGDLLLGLWQGNVWPHWSLGVGVFGLITGLLWLWSDVDQQARLSRRDLAKLAFFTTAGSIIGAFVTVIIDVALGASAREVLSIWLFPIALLQMAWGFGLGCLLFSFRGRALRVIGHRSRGAGPSE